MAGTTLSFAADGAARFCGVLTAREAADLASRLGPDLGPRPGRRLAGGREPLSVIGTPGKVGAVAVRLIGAGARPVRTVLFDKTAARNWTVAWHQDRTIAVRKQIEAEGFGPWSRKDGILHVAPPPEVFERMVTLRLHLDDCGEDNAPLVVALGSHRLGRVAASDAERVAMEHRQLTCLASAGDVWAYSTPILHMSGATRSSARRRVLQVDYAAFELPGGLEWRGLD